MTRRTQRANALTGLAAIVLALGLVGTAGADLVAADFNVGGADTGFTNGWVGSNNVFPIDTNDLIYANYTITQTGTTQRVYSGNATHTDRMDSRNLAAAMTDEIWFSYLVNVPASGNFAGLAFDSDTVPSRTVESYSHALSELRVLMSATQLVVDVDGDTLPAGTGTFAADTTHLILGQMIVAAGNDTLKVWVDPNLTIVGSPSRLPAADYTSTAVDFADSIARLGVPNSDATASNAVHIDAIRLSDTETAFYDVAGATPPPNGMVFVVR
jgi:hypothetical protein